MILAITIVTLVIIFFAWIFYTIAVKKEKEFNSLTAGIFFTALFVVLFYFLMKVIQL